MLAVNCFCAVRRMFLRRSISFQAPTHLSLKSCRMASTLPNLPIFQAISNHDLDSTAVIHSDSNQVFSYGTLLRDIVAAKKQISRAVRGSPLHGERIAFLAENSYESVGT